MDAFTIIFWVSLAYAFLGFLYLALRYMKKPRRPHRTPLEHRTAIDRDLERESYEDSQFEIGSGSSLFPEEPEPEDENT
jgi:hypothetical protein